MKEKISLRKFKMSDLDRIMQLFVNKEVLKGIGLNKKPEEITTKFERDWVKKSINNYSRKKPENYNLAILLDGVHVGNIGCQEIDHENSNLEIGYWLGKEYWGKGYMTKALKLFLKEIKMKFDPVRITAYHFLNNSASGKVLEKCGFKYEGTRRKTHKVGKVFLDDRIDALVK